VTTHLFMEQAAGLVAGAPPVVGMGMSVALTLISGFSTGLGGLIAAFLGALLPSPTGSRATWVCADVRVRS